MNEGVPGIWSKMILSGTLGAVEPYSDTLHEGLEIALETDNPSYEWEKNSEAKALIGKMVNIIIEVIK